MTISFISYFIYLILGLGAFFLIRKFGKEESLSLFAFILLTLSCLLPLQMQVGDYWVMMNVVFIPILILCLITLCKQDHEKAKNLFYKLLIVLGSAFLVQLVAEVVLACQGYGAISWDGIGVYVSLAVSLTVSMFVGKILFNKFPQKGYLFKSLFLLILSAIEAVIFTVLKYAFVNNITFKVVMLCTLFSLLFVAGTCFASILVENILLPKFNKDEEQPQEEVVMEEPVEEPQEEVIEEVAEEASEEPSEEPKDEAPSEEPSEETFSPEEDVEKLDNGSADEE